MKFKKGIHYNPATEFKKGQHANISTEFKKGHTLNKGKIRSQEYRKNLSIALKGRISPNKGKVFTEKWRQNLSLAHKSPRPYMTGLKHSEETKRKISESRKGKLLGITHPNWKGGITPLNHQIRNTTEYKQWRMNVFKRDYWTCQICGFKGKKIIANHIKRFKDYPELRLEITNGITICRECDIQFVLRREEEWESYFNFNLMARRFSLTNGEGADLSVIGQAR